MNRTIRLSCLVLLILILFGLSTGSAAQESTALPLSEPGPFAVGTHVMTLVDAKRANHEFDVQIWYPATEAGEDTPPYSDEAPYPVVVYAHGGGGHEDDLGAMQHLASYGFVTLSPDHRTSIGGVAGVWVDRPMDVALGLTELEILTASGKFEGMVDLERLGVLGWSLGGTTALQLGGMRNDFASESAYCAEHARESACPPQTTVDAARDYMTKLGEFDEDGLWYCPIEWTFDAIIALNPGFAPLFGERGTAHVTSPTLIMAGYLERDVPYPTQVFFFEHLGTEERTFITVKNQGHLFPATPETTALMTKHFVVAFLGYHLQDNETYADYLTEDYVNGIEGLYWGVYSE